MERAFCGIIDKINAEAFLPFIRMKASFHSLFPFFPCASVSLLAALTVGVSGSVRATCTVSLSERKKQRSKTNRPI